MNLLKLSGIAGSMSCPVLSHVMCCSGRMCTPFAISIACWPWIISSVTSCIVMNFLNSASSSCCPPGLHPSSSTSSSSSSPSTLSASSTTLPCCATSASLCSLSTAVSAQRGALSTPTVHTMDREKEGGQDSLLAKSSLLLLSS